jgi:hypothetical protein
MSNLELGKKLSGHLVTCVFGVFDEIQVGKKKDIFYTNIIHGCNWITDASIILVATGVGDR